MKKTSKKRLSLLNKSTANIADQPQWMLDGVKNEVQFVMWKIVYDFFFVGWDEIIAEA